MNSPTFDQFKQQAIAAGFEEVIERDASDLHITVGERPMLRVDGDIVPARWHRL